MNTPINWDLPILNGFGKTFIILSLNGPDENFPVVAHEEGTVNLETFSLEGAPKMRYSQREDLHNAPLRATGWLLFRLGLEPKLLGDQEPEVMREMVKAFTGNPNFHALKRIDLTVEVGQNDFAEMYPTPLEEIMEEFKSVAVQDVVTQKAIPDITAETERAQLAASLPNIHKEPGL